MRTMIKQALPSVWGQKLLAVSDQMWSPNSMRRERPSIIYLEIFSFMIKVRNTVYKCCWVNESVKLSINWLIDETGKYKTGKCTVDYFLQIANKYGIELSDISIAAIREKVLPSG